MKITITYIGKRNTQKGEKSIKVVETLVGDQYDQLNVLIFLIQERSKLLIPLQRDDITNITAYVSIEIPIETANI